MEALVQALGGHMRLSAARAYAHARYRVVLGKELRENRWKMKQTDFDWHILEEVVDSGSRG